LLVSPVDATTETASRPLGHSAQVLRYRNQLDSASRDKGSVGSRRSVGFWRFHFKAPITVEDVVNSRKTACPFRCCSANRRRWRADLGFRRAPATSHKATSTTRGSTAPSPICRSAASRIWALCRVARPKHSSWSATPPPAANVRSRQTAAVIRTCIPACTQRESVRRMRGTAPRPDLNISVRHGVGVCSPPPAPSSCRTSRRKRRRRISCGLVALAFETR
jgi:hypothetical protein